MSAQLKHNLANVKDIHATRNYAGNARRYLGYRLRGKSDMLAPSLSHVIEVLKVKASHMGDAPQKRKSGAAKESK
jgi:hypothetical protein